MSSNVALLITKGIDKHYFAEYKTRNPTYKQLFHMDTMDGRYYDVVTWSGYDNPRVTMPFQPGHQSQIEPSFTKRFIAACYTLGDCFAFEDVKDDMYGLLHRLVPGRAGMMVRSYITNRERLTADMFAVAGFSAASPVPGSPDGVSLFSTAHPMRLSLSGTTWSNRPSVAVDLSHSAYNAAYTNLSQQMAPNNYDIVENRPAKLVYNPSQRAIAVQIAEGEYERSTTNTHDMNMGKRDRLTLVEWPYFRKTGAASAAGTWNGWFVQGEEHYASFMTREEFQSLTDVVNAIRAYEVDTYERFDFGYSDARGHYGSPGN